jgi:hypothetical protein
MLRFDRLASESTRFMAREEHRLPGLRRVALERDRLRQGGAQAGVSPQLRPTGKPVLARQRVLRQGKRRRRLLQTDALQERFGLFTEVSEAGTRWQLRHDSSCIARRPLMGWKCRC